MGNQHILTDSPSLLKFNNIMRNITIAMKYKSEFIGETLGTFILVLFGCGSVAVSILFGALILAGREIQPSGVPKMIQGIILVCLIASDFLLRYRIIIDRGEE